MQSLTPEQSKQIVDFMWKVADKAIWALVIWGVARVKKSIESIRPGIVNDVVAMVSEKFESRWTTHEKMDGERFKEVNDSIGSVRTELDGINKKLASITINTSHLRSDRRKTGTT